MYIFQGDKTGRFSNILAQALYTMHSSLCTISQGAYAQAKKKECKMADEWNPTIKLIEGEVHRYFLRGAYFYAWGWSDDPVTKTGAVIANPSLEEAIACGVNHFPKGLKAAKEIRDNRDWKLKHIIHAEPAAIYAAARAGKSTEGATMYMPWVPCTDCAKAIIDAGIQKMVGHRAMIMKTPKRWWESTDYALTLLADCGVELFMYDGAIGGVNSLFNGEEWEP